MLAPSAQSPRVISAVATTVALGLVMTLCLASTASAQSQDRVRLVGGKSKSGEIIRISALGVTIEKSGKTTEITIPEIRSIIFRGEPSELTQARLNALGGAYESALTRLAAINLDSVRGDYVKQEIEFWNVYCNAKLALVGSKPIREAGGALNKFVLSNKQSYHFLNANELLGDLLMSMGNYPAAQQKYTLLARAPWPAYRIKSSVLVGQTLLAQEKYAEALEQFQTALDIKDDSDEGKNQHLAAKLGLGVATSGLGKVQQGTSMVEQVIRGADPENANLLAPAYNALGACYTKAKQPKQALYAYLHVDLLYGHIGKSHAEALHHLAPLWETIGQDGEARRVRLKLVDQYPASQWAQKTNP